MNIEVPVGSEVLTQDELREITGRAHKDEKIAWLKDNKWTWVPNAAGQPIVGRFYARMKLAGVDLTGATIKLGNPDFSQVR